MSSKEIKLEISSIKKEMKSSGVRRISCFNGGLSQQEYSYNSRLFALQVELDKARQSETKDSDKK